MQPNGHPNGHPDGYPELDALLALLHRLRAPEGNAWDQAQSPHSAATHLSNEAHELVDAMARGNPGPISEELADCLMMLLFTLVVQSEASPVTVDDLALRARTKLEGRLANLDSTGKPAPDEAEQRRRWQAAKGDDSHLPELSASTSPLRQAHSHGYYAAQLGFEWDSPEPVIAKVHEELAELAEAREAKDEAAIAEEVGDLLFAATQLARKLNVDPDVALRQTNRKFAKRFAAMEAKANLAKLSTDQLHALWEEVKRELRN